MQSMEVVERSYYTPPHCRLATFKEARDNVEVIKQLSLLKGWDWGTARLLDGWICGPRYNFQMGDDFRRCMGHMLIIQIEAPANSINSGDPHIVRSVYADVMLTNKEKEVALLLCVQDWNYQVVYWVLNSWDKSGCYMNPGDDPPFSNDTTFLEMNKMICHLGRILSEEGLASHKMAKRKLCPISIKEELFSMGISCWNKFDQADKKSLGHSFLTKIHSAATNIRRKSLELDWLQDFASQTDISEAIWNFLWCHLSDYIIAGYALCSLALLIKKWANDKIQPLTRSQRDFILSTCILHYLSQYEQALFDDYEVGRILQQAWKDPQRFKDMLQNPPSSYYDKNGNYDVLNKILIFAVRNGDTFVVDKVLQWGSLSLASLSSEKQNMAVYSAIYYERIDILKTLFDHCPSKEQLANTTCFEGMTPLHFACRWKYDVRMCELLLEYGARRDVPDDHRKLSLHYAVENGKNEIVNMLIGRGNSATTLRYSVEDGSKLDEIVSWKDKSGESPLDIAIKQNNIKLMVKLLSVSKKPLETYFDKMDSGMLVREFASEGKLEIVKKLLESGADPLACNEQDQTALHYAAMSEDEYKACQITELILNKCDREEEKKNLVAKQDKSGRTALHVATMKRHRDLCRDIVCTNGDIIGIKDEQGRIFLYDAVKGDHDYSDFFHFFVMAWKIDVDSIVDGRGLTLLHVAASEGKMNIVDCLLSCSKHPKLYVKTPDFFGQTALHKAAKGGHVDTVIVLLRWGAQPLFERDCDGRTALHFVAQTNSDERGMKMGELLLKKCGSNEKKLLFLWASAAGLRTADQNLSDSSPLKCFLLAEKKNITAALKGKKQENNLLRTAACLGDIEMTKELLTRGAQIADIQDPQWRHSLTHQQRNNVRTVYQQIQCIAQQGNDKPALSDNLGRGDYAYGLAGLLLNPYLTPPITVGISGSWGMGKSSLMIQTEGIMLKTSAQLALLPSSKLSSSNFPGVQTLQLSTNGRKKYERVKRKLELLEIDSKIKDNFFGKISKWWKKRKNETSKTQFTNGQPSHPETDSCKEGSVPAILTVRYNAWKYRNESEALAGMAVEISKEMEGIMTDAQWLSTCWRNSWRKQKRSIWIGILFPFVVVVLLAVSFTWILWHLFDKYKIKGSVRLKYASLPTTILIIVCTLLKNLIKTLNPVSRQLMNYITFPNHSKNLGYQQTVISDITFLKEEIGKKPFWFCNAAGYIISLLSSKYSGDTMASPTPSANLRIIAFVDDLDRCQESVILQVLSAINLVLAECQISVVLGMDKSLIERAIMQKFGDKQNSKQLADKYLQKIIQVPLDLPDPSEDQSMNFLKRQLGVFADEEDHPKPIADAQEFSISEIDAAYDALFSPFDREGDQDISDLVTKMLAPQTPVRLREESISAVVTKQALPETKTAEAVAIDMQPANRTSDQSWSDIIPISDMLFVRYSEGEREAFCYFERMDRDYRKLPREWKRLLNYHRLVWYIFIINNEAKDLDGWQVQLITWIFICWEWEENINILIKNWNNLGIIFKPSKAYSSGPSLRMIVEHSIQNESWIVKATEHPVEKGAMSEKTKEVKKAKAHASQNTKVPESSKKEPSKVDVVKDQKIAVSEPEEDICNAKDDCESSIRAGMEKLDDVTKKEDDRSEKTIKDELDALKNEMKQVKEQVGSLKAVIKEQLDSLTGKLQEELKEHVESIIKQRQDSKSEKSAEENTLKLESWERLKFALQKYDVSMDGIRAFQRFRFYCVAGHLPCPLPQSLNAEV
ncbi:hypothetical protein KI387_038469 [Taxus chinensis]|uniref:KAP NTPase domain-containing protein n=1 Tax=Taxus chinensis TaxID=29808 RepID=A0AA38FAW2_TAXCH|nr:hypothetical protein KI387_038469 [Taxus chinensis]